MATPNHTFGARWAVLLVLCGSALAGCEEHHAAATRGEPEYLHQALSGDAQAQDVVAGCYAKAEGCLGIPPDPPLGCAWRGVRLASHSPELSLADTDAFAAACATRDATSHQRSMIAFTDLAARIYRRKFAELPELPLAEEPTLYPSIEMVRSRANLQLLQAHRAERLPPFGPPVTSNDGKTLDWSSCSQAICLQGVSPSFGGGVLSYRVAVGSSAGDPGRLVSLAATLAAAGLQSPSSADEMAGAPLRAIEQGPVCWTAGRDAHGGAFAEASRYPCGVAPGGRG
jgi:hypothetical protein